MDCEHIQRILHPYLDGELGPSEVAQLEEHCVRCPECSALRDQQQALSLRLKGIIPRTASPALRARIQEAMDATATAPRTPRAGIAPHPLRHPIAWRIPASLAAALALGWLLGDVHHAAGPHDQLTHDLVALHQRSLLPGHLTDVPSSNQHIVKPWFAGKVDYAPWADDLASLGYPLEGGRVDIVDGRRVAVLVFRHNQHLINLVERPISWAEDGAFSDHTADGYQILCWATQGQHFAAITDMNAADLAAFATTVRAHQ
jgi:anti-sigma factor RsiW